MVLGCDIDHTEPEGSKERPVAQLFGAFADGGGNIERKRCDADDGWKFEVKLLEILNRHTNLAILHGNYQNCAL